MSNRTKIQLHPDGFSIHTFELRYQMQASRWKDLIKIFYTNAQGKKSREIYRHKGVHIFTRFSSLGLILEFKKSNKANQEHYFCDARVNPRKMIEPASSYLGIMPKDASALALLSERFTDYMRKLTLPEFLDDWVINRVDFCTNIQFNNASIAKELIRTARKWPTPPKAKRHHEEHRHSVTLRYNSFSLVIYDKRYQLESERLLKEGERIPKGIIRAKVQYRRSYINKTLAQFKDLTTTEALHTLQLNSRVILLKHIIQNIPNTSFLKPDGIHKLVSNSSYSRDTKSRMLFLTQQLRRKRGVDAALDKTTAKFSLTSKQSATLLRNFDALGISPIPLQVKYFRPWLPSIPQILNQIDEDGEGCIMFDE